MEKPNQATVDWYEAAIPRDARAVKGQMFGHPCAFVGGHMFFGTFAQSAVARVGVEKAQALTAAGIKIFEPMAGRAWREYVQIPFGTMTSSELAALAKDAFEATAALPPKEKKAAAPKKTQKAPSRS